MLVHVLPLGEDCHWNIILNGCVFCRLRVNAVLGQTGGPKLVMVLPGLGKVCTAINPELELVVKPQRDTRQRYQVKALMPVITWVAFVAPLMSVQVVPSDEDCHW